MSAEQQPLDITDLPELARIADEVRATQRPRLLRRGNEDIAMLVPVGHAKLTPMPYNPKLAAVLAKLPKDSVVARTAGALHTDQPFLGTDEEREAAAEAMVRDIMAEMED